jgi:gas vesicle protein
MNNQHAHQHDQNQHGGMNPVVAGVAGAVVGAGAAALAATMSDEKKRQQAKEAIDKAKDTVANYAENLKKQAEQRPEVKEAEKNVQENSVKWTSKNKNWPKRQTESKNFLHYGRSSVLPSPFCIALSYSAFKSGGNS